MDAAFLSRSLLGLALFASTLAAAPVGWRNDGTAVFPNAVPPTEWADTKKETKNIVWKTRMPGQSFGSPIRVGDRLFVVSDPAELLCLNAADGKVLWQRSHPLEDFAGAEPVQKITTEFKRLKDERQRTRREYDRAPKDDMAKRAELKK